MKSITNRFVRIADDSPAAQGKIPPRKEGAEPSVARRHYELLIEHPYEYDHDSFNFEIFCQKTGIDDAERDSYRADFLAKGHPCMRASPLCKTYGWGAHYNSAGKIAIYPVDSAAYQKFLNDKSNTVDMAMRSARPEKASAAQTTRRHPTGGHHPFKPAA